MKGIIWNLLETAGAAAVAYRAGRWVIACAYLERGYDVVGGEYLALPVFYWLGGRIMHNIIGFWRETYADRKERSGKTSGL